MSNSTLTFLGRGLRRAWNLLDATRRALLNLLLLALLGAGLWAVLKPGAPSLKPKTALVLDIGGTLVEQRADLSVRDQLLGQAQDKASEQTRLRDVVAVLDAAATDAHTSRALLMLDGLSGAGLPTLREVALALERFKAAGKPV